MKGIVMSGTGGVWQVQLMDERRAVDASLRGRLKKSDDIKLAVGDEVRLEPALYNADVLPEPPAHEGAGGMATGG